jgi:hypothetical protein
MYKKLAVAVGFIITTSISIAQPIVTDSTSNSTVNSTSKAETTVKSPPPSAISPSISASNTDLCTVGVSGAVQTQILGISGGTTVRDMNCERLKLSKTLYDMGMKVAAISTLCQDPRVFDAMLMAGTPCPFEGKIGNEAKDAWKQAGKISSVEPVVEDKNETTTYIGWGVVTLLLLGL